MLHRSNFNAYKVVGVAKLVSGVRCLAFVSPEEVAGSLANDCNAMIIGDHQ